MRFGLAATAFAACLLLSGAFAAIEGFPGEIKFYSEPQEIKFTVSNPSDSEKMLSVEFFAPVDANIIAPANIGAKKDANVSITLAPKESALGQEYESTLIVRLGTDETRKTARLSFHKASEKPAQNDSNSLQIAGIISFFSSPNAEIALDIVLAIAAIILIIAFTARLVKRMQVKQ